MKIFVDENIPLMTVRELRNSIQRDTGGASSLWNWWSARNGSRYLSIAGSRRSCLRLEAERCGGWWRWIRVLLSEGISYVLISWR